VGKLAYIAAHLGGGRGAERWYTTGTPVAHLVVLYLFLCFFYTVSVMADKVYLCIDMKSFFASVEAIDRVLDPFTDNLVVADPSRGSGSVCLAITPAMKALGVRNRCRVFEIPKDIKYVTAMPRMKKYMEVSAQIYGIYLRYISAEDIHVYSIDECFLDATPYLKMYKKTPKELAIMLMDAIKAETGICATAGIGTNLFLAKVALDVTAKKVPDHIGYLDIDSFKKELWHHRPITDIWNIGGGIAKRLEKYGVYDLYSVTQLAPEVLYKEFGTNAEYLIDHANGVEPCTIADIHNYQSKSHSLSNSQILFEDYKYDDALIVMQEMVDNLVLELVEKNLVSDELFLGIGYSKDVHRPTGGSRKLPAHTSSFKSIVREFIQLYKDTTVKGVPIRRLSIGLGHLLDADTAHLQLDLFADLDAEKKEKDLQHALLGIKEKFGKNAVLRGINYFEKSTGRARNKMVGGHNG